MAYASLRDFMARLEAAGMPVRLGIGDADWPVDLALAKRWAKGTAILFAVGAVSGRPTGVRPALSAWAPPRARGPRVALVGKGITFDTGGLHLKARGMMEGMKSDMGGAAAVVDSALGGDSGWLGAATAGGRAPLMNPTAGSTISQRICLRH